MKTIELWKPVEGFDSYEVSDLGRVRKVDGTEVNLFNHPQGYLKVALKVAGKKVSKKYVHRLVAAAFIPNPDNLPYVNHKNGKQWCNEVENLEWISSKDNHTHARENGLIDYYKSHRVVSVEDVRYIREHIKPYDKEFGNGAIAKRLGLSRDQVTDIALYRNYKDVI